MRQVPAHPLLYEAIRDAEPISAISGYRDTENRRRHYERLSRQPDNFLVTGDAASAFNPIYAQGMTTAALGAEVLEECLREQGGANGDHAGQERSSQGGSAIGRTRRRATLARRDRRKTTKTTQQQFDRGRPEASAERLMDALNSGAIALMHRSQDRPLRRHGKAAPLHQRGDSLGSEPE